MCGLVGIFDLQGQRAIDRTLLGRMNDRLWHRGPDGEGIWCDDQRRIGLAHRRLAIIDLSAAAAQPMADELNGLVCVFNG